MLDESATPPFVIPNEAEGYLQFCRLVLEMLFDRVPMQIELQVCRASWRSDDVGESMPQPCRARLTFLAVGPFEKLRADSTGLKTQTVSSKTFPGRACGTADPSASLGMTKGRGGASIGIGRVALAFETWGSSGGPGSFGGF